MASGTDASKQIQDVIESVTKLAKAMEDSTGRLGDFARNLEKSTNQISSISKVVSGTYGAWVQWNQVIYDTSKALSLTLNDTVKLEESIKKLSNATVYSQQQIAEMYRIRAQTASLASISEKEFANIVKTTSDVFGQQGTSALQTFAKLSESNRAFATSLAGSKSSMSQFGLALNALGKVGLQGAQQYAQAIDQQRYGSSGNAQYLRNVTRPQELQKQMANLSLDVGREVGPGIGFAQEWGAKGVGHAAGAIRIGGLPGMWAAGDILGGGISGGAGGGGGVSDLINGAGGGNGGGSAQTVNITANVVNVGKGGPGGGGGVGGIPGVGNFAPEAAAAANTAGRGIMAALAIAMSGDKAGKDFANKVNSGEISGDMDFVKEAAKSYLPRALTSAYAGYRVGGPLGAGLALIGNAWTFKGGFERQDAAIQADLSQESVARKIALVGLNTEITKAAQALSKYSEAVSVFGRALLRVSSYGELAASTGQNASIVAQFTGQAVEQQKLIRNASINIFERLVNVTLRQAKEEGRPLSRAEAEAEVLASDKGKEVFSNIQKSSEAISKGLLESKLFINSVLLLREKGISAITQTQQQFGGSSSTLLELRSSAVTASLNVFNDLMSRIPEYLKDAADPNNLQNINRLRDVLSKVYDQLGPVAQKIQEFVSTLKEMPVVFQRLSATLNTMANVSQSVGRPLEVIQEYRAAQLSMELNKLNILSDRYQQLQKLNQLEFQKNQLSGLEGINSPEVQELTKNIKQLVGQMKIGPKTFFEVQQEALQSYEKAWQIYGTLVGETGLTGASSLYMKGLEARRQYSEILPVSAGVQYGLRQEQLTADIRLRDSYLKRMNELLSSGLDSTNTLVQNFLKLYYDQHAKIYSDIMDLWGGFSGRLEAELDKFIHGPEDILNWMPRAAEISAMDVPLYAKFFAKVGSQGLAMRTEPFLRTDEMVNMFKGQNPLIWGGGIPWSNMPFGNLPSGDLLVPGNPNMAQKYIAGFANEYAKELKDGKGSIADSLQELIDKRYQGALPVKLLPSSGSILFSDYQVGGLLPQ